MKHPEYVGTDAPAQDGHATAEQLVAVAERLTAGTLAAVPEWLNAEERKVVAGLIEQAAGKKA